MSKVKDKLQRKALVNTILMIFLFLVGFTLGILYKVFFPTEYTETYKQTRSGGYEYINPLIDFETTDSAKLGEIVSLEKDLQKYINETTIAYKTTKISHISIYYKDLNSGAWIGINEDQTFTPASLLKLPIMIGAYKMAESNPEYLNQQIVFTRIEQDIKQEIEPGKHLEDGQTYTLDQLIERLIKYSDNETLIPIEQLTNHKDLDKIYTDLGIQNPYESDNENIMTVKDYASFFRILYNASYLNKDMSTKALKLLSETEYDNGISAGIPKGIKIANKFGERTYPGEQEYNRQQLHDCGIVYHSTKPYLICIMTKGANITSLQKVIQNISHRVYERVNKE